MRNFWVKTRARVTFQAANRVRILYGFRAENTTYVGPANGSTITAADIVFYVAGTDAQSAFSQAVTVAPSSILFANFYAPSGTLFLDKATQGTGSFVGKNVQIGSDVVLTLATSFNGLAKRTAAKWTQEPERITAAVEVPTSFSLAQNYPNPFNPSTQIRYGLPKATHVSLTIYNMLGEEVSRLVDEVQSEGFHEVRWNGTSSSGATVPTGVYIYRVRADSFTDVKKMILLK